jgi:propionyl-CoA synthetase
MIYFVLSLPKTRSGKLLRRVMQALCDDEDVGDITTIEEEKSLRDIKKVLPPHRQ